MSTTEPVVHQTAIHWELKCIMATCRQEFTLRWYPEMPVPADALALAFAQVRYFT